MAGVAVEGMAQQRKVPLMQSGARVMMQERADIACSMDVAYESYDLPDRMGRSLSLRSESILPMPRLSGHFSQASEGGGRGRFDHDAVQSFGPPPAAPLPPEEIRDLFATLRWDVLGDRLLAGDLSDLSGPQAALVRHLAQDPAILGFSRHFGREPSAVALGLVADLIGDRLGNRYVRRVFRDLPLRMWEDLRLWRMKPPAGGHPW